MSKNSGPRNRTVFSGVTTLKSKKKSEGVVGELETDPGRLVGKDYELCGNDKGRGVRESSPKENLSKDLVDSRRGRPRESV